MPTPPKTSPRIRVVFASSADDGIVDHVRRPGVEIVEHARVVGDDLIVAARGADVLVVRSWHRLGRPELERLVGVGVRAIVQSSSGRDNVDLEAAAALGVRVEFPDPGNAVAVAELTLLSLLVLFRNVRRHWEATPRGVWPDRDRLEDRELRGKSLGVVGLGRVGSRVASRGHAFEMSVLAVDPYVDDARFAACGAERVKSIGELAPRVDALTLHCPLTDETRALVDDDVLALLPRGAVVVNTARGGILVERALERALDEQRLAGAALDVHEREPVEAGGLLAHPRVIATPHCGGHTFESHRERADNTVRALMQVVDALAAESESR